ncbi:hypothetical protein Hanom_Chr17g01552811 [Helianthus anomalus]
MSETSQISLEAPIKHFRLAVRLRMVTCTHLQFCLTQAKQFLPKVAKENNIPVRNNGSRESMKTNNLFAKDRCDSFSSKRMR